MGVCFQRVFIPTRKERVMKKVDHEFVLGGPTGACLFCDRPFADHPTPAGPTKSDLIDHFEEQKCVEAVVSKRTISMVNTRWAVQ